MAREIEIGTDDHTPPGHGAVDGVVIGIVLFSAILVGGYFMPPSNNRFEGKASWIELRCPNQGQWALWGETDKFLWRQEQENNFLQAFGQEGCYRRR